MSDHIYVGPDYITEKPQVRKWAQEAVALHRHDAVLKEVQRFARWQGAAWASIAWALGLAAALLVRLIWGGL